MRGKERRTARREQAGIVVRFSRAGCSRRKRYASIIVNRRELSVAGRKGQN